MHRVDQPERGERLDQRGRLVGLGEQVEVADRLLPSAERAGRLDRADAGRRGQRRRSAPVSSSSARSSRIRSNRSSSRAMPSRTSASVLARHAAQAAQAAALGRLAQIVHRLDPELRRGAGGRSWARAPGSAAARRGSAAPRRGAGRRTPCGRSWRARAILSLMALPTPGIGRRIAGAVGRHEVDRAAPDGVGGAVVGDGLEDELALELEHVADLVEDPGEVAVGQVGRRRSSRGSVAVARRRIRESPQTLALRRRRPGRGRRAWPDRAPGRPRR